MLLQDRLDGRIDWKVTTCRQVFEKRQHALDTHPTGAGGEYLRCLSGMLTGEQAHLFHVHQPHHSEAGGQLPCLFELVTKPH